MAKRYQVFVSSTYEDLQVERQEVIQALLELDCIPAGMELFPAADESQWNLIKRVIDECDYYVVILAGRYGSIGPDGVSYTEMEYRYALSVDKPTIAFIHRDPGKITAKKTEGTDDGKAKLGAFRELVQEKVCKPWETPQELGSVVSRSLVQLIKTHPAVGWVRADELGDEATAELLQLRRQVDELKGELARVRVSAPAGAETLAQGDEQHRLRYTVAVRRPAGDDDMFGLMRSSTTNYRTSTFVTWNEIFSAVAPTMIDEATERVFRNALNGLVRDKDAERLRELPEVKGKSLSNFEVQTEDYQTVKVQLRALGLITKSERKRSVQDKGTYWTLTPYGDEVMTRLRAIRAADAGDAGDGNEEGLSAE